MGASVGGDDEVISLNVMPMLDIFSILILFLLSSYSTDPISHDLTEGVEIPESFTSASLDEIPTLIVSKDEVKINDKKIVTLVDGEVQEKDQEQGAVYALYKSLKSLSEAGKKFKKDEKDKDQPGSLTVEMDASHRFKLIRKMMLSAQQADFVRFKLEVAKGRVD
ncbi:MAG: biopolymer transporter ExbD [Oligoflexales bacterium]